jgi:hypothetical protein
MTPPVIHATAEHLARTAPAPRQAPGRCRPALGPACTL